LIYCYDRYTIIYNFSGKDKDVSEALAFDHYKIDAVCSHEDGPLEHGTLDGYEVECPWHGSKFDVRTGEVTNLPADTPQSVYEVKVQDNNILLKKQGKSKASPQIELRLFAKDKVEGTDVIFSIAIINLHTVFIIHHRSYSWKYKGN
jgi:Rieske [2Fe-2S] domain